MATTTFDTLKSARHRQEAGFSRKQAEAQGEMLAEAFKITMEDLVTREYLDARLEAFKAQVDAKFRLVIWAQGLTIAVIVLPQLRAFFTA
ncbi:hypothetical protein BST95_00570 [Halioglobus japonicus]|uniref:DUF1640 domain-containing protein n=1 Tax=Halioglobus japonicus TaxID=930805 RepID=A0AAP8MBL9_9GAMM|nr:hypothetical protein [Halioglobus japonicus]AQA16940.1 hypothetical protein BST95_00570 [Halioglobus japonicus]PLW84822.1 hypothetical protein C0029_17635 [Halioglobus japonicus]GHD21587.1 hypothetical protein GCM10007052_32560 [Halioglobus japonicus]